MCSELSGQNHFSSPGKLSELLLSPCLHTAGSVKSIPYEPQIHTNDLHIYKLPCWRLKSYSFVQNKDNSTSYLMVSISQGGRIHSLKISHPFYGNLNSDASCDGECGCNMRHVYMEVRNQINLTYVTEEMSW